MAVTPAGVKGAHDLKKYWTQPGQPGYIRIAWGTPGDFLRCVALLEPHVRDAKGLCNTYHVAALGVAPGQEH